jgi:hypothetical protein
MKRVFDGPIKTAIQIGKTGKEKLTDTELKELTAP